MELTESTEKENPLRQMMLKMTEDIQAEIDREGLALIKLDAQYQSIINSYIKG
jgi:hypothetical protein